MLGKEAETESQTHTGSPPVRRKRDCGLEVRASLRLTEAPWMAYRAESLQLWLGLLKSCPRRGWACQEGLSWGAGKAGLPVQHCPAPQSCSRELCEPSWWGGQKGVL